MEVGREGKKEKENDRDIHRHRLIQNSLYILIKYFWAGNIFLCHLIIKKKSVFFFAFPFVFQTLKLISAHKLKDLISTGTAITCIHFLSHPVQQDMITLSDKPLRQYQHSNSQRRRFVKRKRKKMSPSKTFLTMEACAVNF